MTDSQATIVAAIIMGVCAIVAALIPIFWSVHKERRERLASEKDSRGILLPHGALLRPTSWRRRVFSRRTFLFLIAGAAIGYLIFRLLVPAAPAHTTPQVPRPSPTSGISLTPDTSPSPSPNPASTSTPTPTTPSTVTPTTIASCSSTGAVLLEESFDSNDRSWVVDNTIQYPYTIEHRQIRSGALRFSALFTEDATTTVIVPGIDAQDFVLEFTSTVIDTSGPGPARIAAQFRRTLGSYYLPRFSSDNTYGLHLRLDETLYEVIPFAQTDAFDLAPGMTNTFSIVADGWMLTLCANGQIVGQVSNPSLTQTGVLAIGLGGSKGTTVTALFDNVVVKEIP